MKTRLTLAMCLIVSAFLLDGCATSASNLKPNDLPSDKVAFMGQIRAFNKRADITSKCYAEFTDSNQDRKLYTSLDESGWIFSTATAGETYLSRVLCTVGGLIKQNIQYESRDLHFTLPNNRKQITYFGNVTIYLEHDTSVSPAILLGGAVAGAIAATPKNAGKPVTVENQAQEAAQEYRQRYGNDSAQLQLAGAVIQVSGDTRAPAAKK